jgi:type III pantothenate kinase
VGDRHLRGRRAASEGRLRQQGVRAGSQRREFLAHHRVGRIGEDAPVPLRQALRQIFEREPLFIEPGIKTGMPILYDQPQEVGADRIVNAVAALARMGGPCVVVDFGTATTFDVVTARGEYAGGVIVPGISISAEALFEKAARLWRVEIRRPEHVIGKTTSSSIQSGLYFGYLSLVDGMIDRIAAEIGGKPRVIATGGLAGLFGGGSARIDEVDPLLTLQGLRLIDERNRGG